MKRIEKVYEFIKEESLKYNEEKFKNQGGLTAVYISQQLNVLRNNVSSDLNSLVREKKVIKIKKRPVLYFDKARAEQIVGKKFSKEEFEVPEFERIFHKNLEKNEDNPFERLIGAKDSLKNQVEQAKAAIMYPPNGLHTLIVGQTGVGKTLFANLMYKYGVYTKKYNNKTPFVVFNCADYYNNPQLLISHIFGHIKGAFTGADTEKAGLIEKSNGGILFLDEIHRLPPEGQEMIFYFMDSGTYNKLGETDRNRSANVLIIGATTEEPDSYLLKTFVRRIPIVINIPPLENRSIDEILALIRYLLVKEANRVNKNIVITSEVVKALIGSVSFGNIGQLKSNIQLICAKGFLNSINSESDIELNLKILPSNIKNGLINIGNRRDLIKVITKYVDSHITITPHSEEELVVEEDQYELPFNLYKIIEDKSSVLRNEGMDDESIKKFITTDINVHLKCFYEKFSVNVENRDKLLKIVDKQIIDIAEEIKNIAEVKLNRKYNDRFLYALSLHISAFLKRVENGEKVKYTDMSEFASDSHKEYSVAVEATRLIEKEFKLKVPKMEVMYLTLLLSSIEEDKVGKVGIIVAAHGDNVATGMTNVAQKLLGDSDNIVAVNMPLEVSPKVVLDKVIQKAKEVDQGKGILLLVDMGSLTTFDTIIEKESNVKVRCIDMVSTPLVLEAVRKANMLEVDVDMLYNSLKNFKGYSSGYDDSSKEAGKKRAVVTICSTGSGTAVKLKNIVQDIIKDSTNEAIECIPISIKGVNEKIIKLNKSYNIIAVVGVVKPKTDVPFISIENLINGMGEKFLKELIVDKKISSLNNDNNIVVRDICEESLSQFLTYLNSKKIVGILISFVDCVEKSLEIKFNNSEMLNLMLHVGCALERIVIKDSLKYTGDIVKDDTFYKIKAAGNNFKEILKLELTDDELMYIIDIIHSKAS
ncbi:sigma 54-interacting transcriptional regulator [Clostridium neuense]|uniref:Sigma 54-interacting transcriptional regulator n=1 Tax=Clostridium neuense TaxID=1728934 RepID=A0ABW8TLL9_9CLOT